MLKQLRASTKWIMIIVIVFFVGMIVLQWGMDIGGRREGVASRMIGEVNGVEVTYEYYSQLIKNQRDRFGQNQRLTFEQSRMIHEQVWNSIVTNILIEQEIESRGISYTDTELINFMLSNPVQLAYQVPLFMEDDTFSITKYQDFIQNPQNLNDPQARPFLDYIEMQARQALPRFKLQQILGNSAFVTDSDVREYWLSDNEQRKVDWLFVNIAGLEPTNTISPELLRAYYEENKEDYRHDELRSLEAVFFSLAATSADTSETRDRAELLAKRAKDGEDFSELANSYSDDPGNDYGGEKRGGDLGFFGRNRMTPDFEEVAFSMMPGEVSEPFLTEFGFHIVRVDSIKYTDEDNKEIDQVKPRHILLRIEPSSQTRDEVDNIVKAFYESTTGGMDFNLRAQMDSLEIVRTNLFKEDTSFIPSIGNNTQLLVKRTFSAKKDDVLPVYYTDSGYYVMKVFEIKEAGIPPFEDLQNPLNLDLMDEVRARYAENYILRANEYMKEGKDLRAATEAVADTVSSPEVETVIVNRNYNIQGLGAMNPFIAKIIALENTGDCTGPVITEKGSGIAVLLEKLPIDEPKFQSEKTQLKSRLESELRNDVTTRYIENLRTNAEIVDNRDLFFSL